jgi:hypothetical protein
MALANAVAKAEVYFKIKERGSTWGTEFKAGCATFVTLVGNKHHREEKKNAGTTSNFQKEHHQKNAAVIINGSLPKGRLTGVAAVR